MVFLTSILERLFSNNILPGQGTYIKGFLKNHFLIIWDMYEAARESKRSSWPGIRRYCNYSCRKV